MARHRVQLGLLAVAVAVLPGTVWAESAGASAAATQHAYEELQNAIAQGKVTLTPTPTMTPSPTFTVTPTSTPTLVPTATPTPEPAVVEEPCWLTDIDWGDPNDNYIVFDEDGAPVPCQLDQPPPVSEPTPEPEPRAVNAETPAIARAAAVSAPVASPPAAAVAPTPLPTYTPYPTYTAVPTSTVAPTLTATATATRTVTPTPRVTASPTATATATATRTLVPIGAATGASSREQPAGHWEWTAFLAYLAAAISIAVLFVAFISHRRVAVWKGKSNA